MIEILIQKLIIPKVNDEMYLRGASIDNCRVLLSNGEAVSFDTYYNSFSYTKYRDYTELREIAFRCIISGKVTIELCVFDGKDTAVVKSSTFEGDKIECRIEADFLSLPSNGFLYPKIISNGISEFFVGEYTSECISTEISVCIAVCTFRREQYVLKNIDQLRNTKFQYINKVFIIDNGGTLDSAISDNFINVLKNKNYGGSGGFTRGLLEAMDGDYTHVILMDDDVEFYNETLEQMTSFVSLLKKEYSESWFSAAMLPFEKPWEQFEMGARWNGKSADVHKHKADVRDRNVLADNLINPDVQYGGWWTLLMPVSSVKAQGLPYPFFIKFDDVEYGMRKRSGTEIITMNGVAIRHEAFDRKTSFVLDYYNLRNELVVNCIYGNLRAFGALRRFWYEVMKQLMLYRYDNCSSVFRAVENFLGGVDFFLNCDEEKLNTELIKVTPKLSPLSEFPEWSENLRNINFEKDNHISFLAAITLGGHLIPLFLMKNELVAIPLSRAGQRSIFMKERVLQYQLEGESGILTKRSTARFFNNFLKAIGVSLKLLLGFSRAKQSLIERNSEITSVDFWRKHLGI